VPLRRPSEAPWYAAGLEFRCTACGACCTGEPGYVFVTSRDVERMAKHKGMSPEAFARLYVRRVGKRLSLKERRNGDCVMLENRKCSVYPVKPTPCSTFPFWPEILESRDEWDATAERCPGMNRGERYTREEVDAVRSGVSAVLLEKQAAAREREARSGGGDASPPAVPEAAWRAALEELDRIYADLDAELPRHKFLCQASGDCCDFDAFGHRLYASTLEVERFFRTAPPGRANENPRSCPAWGKDRLCTAREGRMLGCRTFFCAGGQGADPNAIYERYYRRVKDVHERHGIPFRYADIVEWSRERRPARAQSR
jgi:Fe-S-cluster containining protein